MKADFKSGSLCSGLRSTGVDGRIKIRQFIPVENTKEIP